MTDFWFNLQLGLEHILDPRGYDHILFVIALCAVYTYREWKQVAWLVTAFTLGHSLTLALATFQIINISSDLIEFLIPITILITCIVNFTIQTEALSAAVHRRKTLQRYALAAFFGLIHGLGFSNFLKSILPRDVTIWKPLLAFNLGLEIGQLVIVGFVLLLGYGLMEFLKTPRREWILVVSGIIAGVALTIIQEKWIF
ncbi:MAG: HupE/UreJ family protein [Saprospiraceae bacterium]|nr:HupE/UreJ family protein [Saprospiraceae bacterium]